MEDMGARLNQLLPSFQKQLEPQSVTLSNLSRKNAESSVEARKKGNQLYTEKNNHNCDVHRRILLQYSKSIAFAPLESEELAVAYSNRSVLFLHLQRYADCLGDIEKSIKISRSDNLQAKLKSRKMKCLELMESSNQKSIGKGKAKIGGSLPSNDYNGQIGFYKMRPSSEIPMGSEAISTSYNENLGRHLVATRDLKAGEVLLVERSFSCLPRNSQTYLVCNHCLKSAWNGIPCDNCALGIYCSEECKKEAWEEYHEVECSLLPFMSFIIYEDDDISNLLMMAVRMLVKAINKEGLHNVLMDAKADAKGLEGMTIDGILQHHKFKAFYSLLSHKESLKDILQRTMLNAAQVIQLLSKHTSIFDAAKCSNDGTLKSQITLQLETILGTLINIVKVNSFEYHGSFCDCQNFGKVSCECHAVKGMHFATCASLINHSCAPNVSRMNVPKRKIVLFTSTPIKKGEQLCASYGPIVGLPRESRQECLKYNYFFTCKCICCEENWLGNGPFVTDMRQKEEKRIRNKITEQFNKSFPHGKESSLFEEDIKNWKFDGEQLKMALKMTDLVYKCYKSPLACLMHSVRFRMYIDRAFNKLFGENAVIPEDCLNA